MDMYKRLYLELLSRIRKGMTGTSEGPLFVASPQDIAILDKLAKYITRSEEVRHDGSDCLVKNVVRIIDEEDEDELSEEKGSGDEPR